MDHYIEICLFCTIWQVPILRSCPPAEKMPRAVSMPERTRVSDVRGFAVSRRQRQSLARARQRLSRLLNGAGGGLGVWSG